jgi:predicted lipoprotein with Yx(FWY)xxD motif
MAAKEESASGDFSIITRDDGSKQWAVKGKPVYYWVKDSKPGDKTGDGVNGIWRVAKP